jgi:hypothetical protein
VDGVQKNMTIENKNWTASKPIAGFTADQNWNGLDNRADTGAIYALSTALPGLEETTNGLTNSDSSLLMMRHGTPGNLDSYSFCNLSIPLAG